MARAIPSFLQAGNPDSLGNNRFNIFNEGQIIGIVIAATQQKIEATNNLFRGQLIGLDNELNAAPSYTL